MYYDIIINFSLLIQKLTTAINLISLLCYLFSLMLVVCCLKISKHISTRAGQYYLNVKLISHTFLYDIIYNQ